MTTDLLIQNFDTLAAAPGGVPKLRELILSLAVRGQLVPNDPPSEILPSEISNPPYAIPRSWWWARLGAVAEVERGGSPRPIKAYLTDDPRGLNWIKIGDTEIGGKFILSTRERIRKEGLSKTRLVHPGDFLLTNSMSFGRPYITKIEGCIHDGWLRISPPTSIDKDYLYYLLSSRCVAELFRAAVAGAVVQNLNADKVRQLPIPLPPLPEQRRIVAKVDELMALCDALEAQQEAAQKTQSALTRSALHHLTTATPADFSSRWKFVGTNFQALELRPENVAELRKAILQLAVDGKLIGSEHTEEHINSTRVGDCVEFLNGYAFKSQWFQSTGIRLVRNVNVGHGRLDWINEARIPEDRAGEFARFCLRVGDIVLSLDRPLINTGLKVARVNKGDLPCLLLQRVAKVELRNDKLVPAYFLTWLQSPRFTDAIDPGRSKGVPHISTRQVESMEFNLPSVAEQHRIVAKVDELMKLCDALEAGLARERAEADRLFDAVVARLTEVAA